MNDLAWMQLPVRADEGFPQSFRLAMGKSAYAVSMYVNVVDPDGPAREGEVYDLTRPGAFMVMSVTREGPGTARTLLRRKLVVDHVYLAGELAFTFRRLTVHRGNLNAPGSFGSLVDGGVASRWA